MTEAQDILAKTIAMAVALIGLVFLVAHLADLLAGR